MKKRNIFLFLVLFILLTSVITKVEAKPLLSLPIRPTNETYITSHFGWRIHPVTNEKSFHNGIDIGVSKGTHVYAFTNGVVTIAKGNGLAGNEIRINHGNGLETRYLHMDKKAVNVGDIVKVGQVIGTVGATGRVTGAHLHFEIRKWNNPINPARIMRKK